jgi:hypothetical protein
VSSSAGFIPHATSAREKQGRLGIARTYATAQVDNLALKSNSSTRGAFISIGKKVVEDIMDQWKLEQSRIMHGDSLGIRALYAAVSGATFTCDSAYGIASGGPGNMHLDVGDQIAIIDQTDGTMHHKATITGYTSTASDVSTFTMSATMTGGADGDYVVTAVPAATDTNDNSFGAEPHGWKSIVDVEGNWATFEGIKDAKWLAQKLTNSTLDELQVMKLLNTIRAKAGVEWRDNPKKCVLVTTTGIWQAYGELLLGLRRFAAPTMTILTARVGGCTPSTRRTLCLST